MKRKQPKEFNQNYSIHPYVRPIKQLALYYQYYFYNIILYIYIYILYYFNFINIL